MQNKARGLSDKQERFVEEYLIDRNATKAAIRAGYSARNAGKLGPRMVNHPLISARIAAATAELSKHAGLSAEWVLERQKQIVDRCMTAEPVLDRDGEPTGEYRFDAAGANRALELIGKHIGMYSERVEHSGDLNVTVRFADPDEDG